MELAPVKPITFWETPYLSRNALRERVSQLWYIFFSNMTLLLLLLLANERLEGSMGQKVYSTGCG
jgi:hypothetical protein